MVALLHSDLARFCDFVASGRVDVGRPEGEEDVHNEEQIDKRVYNDHAHLFRRLSEFNKTGLLR